MSGSESIPKRRRLERARSPSPVYKLDDADDYEPYIPLSKRREAKLAAFASRGVGADDKARDANGGEGDEEEDEEERERERERKERTLLMEAQEVNRKKAAEGTSLSTSVPRDRVLLVLTILFFVDAQKTVAEKKEEEDQAILTAIASRKKLASDMELAKGIQYTDPLKTSCVIQSPSRINLWRAV